MRFYNLTPHEIYYDDGETVATIRSDGVLRATETDRPAGVVHNFRVVQKKYGGFDGLPANLESGDVIIVSSIAANAILKNQPELIRSLGVIVLVPDTGRTCRRNAAGQITAVTQFIRIDVV